MPERKAPPTFVSSLRAAAKGKQYYVFLMQPGWSRPLKLEYPTRDSAFEARGQILRAGNAHYVSNYKLFKTISQTISDLQKKEDMSCVEPHHEQLP